MCGIIGLFTKKDRTGKKQTCKRQEGLNYAPPHGLGPVYDTSCPEFTDNLQDKAPLAALRKQALKMASIIRHRGPDSSGIYCDGAAALAHERLSIIDVDGGGQPLYDKKTGRRLVANGEIYNHQELRARLRHEHEFRTLSDCEVLLYLYDEFGPDFISMISGIFAFIIYDPITGNYLVARDHIGICPLYMGKDANGTAMVASEMKALDKYCKQLWEFAPGHYYLGHLGDEACGDLVKYYQPDWMLKIPTGKISEDKLRFELEQAVSAQLMADVPYGVLISGGLDSSIIAAIAKQHHGTGELHSFAIGLEESPDLLNAQKVARFLGTTHHEFKFTVQQGIDSLRDVIYHLETFDVTTIRASTPMYLMARKIRALGIKMVLSGEGADEIFGGYLYFHMAPDAGEFHEETVRKLSFLSKYDCLRANKSMAAWGVEVRVPFLDKGFLGSVMNIDPQLKMCGSNKIEKGILRRSFDGYLPAEILWRQKEQFSDGVGYSWIDSLKALAQREVTDEQMKRATERFAVQTPSSKEEYLYRSIFDEFFESPSAALTVPIGPSIACSTPTAIRWSKEFVGREDPSGRAVLVHANSNGSMVLEAKID